MQFVSFDNVVLIYKPLIMHDFVLIPAFFVTIMLVVGIVLMNFVTAVIVQSALDQAGQDKELMKFHEEKRKKKLIRELRKIFLRLDEDNSGQLSRDEIVNVNEEERRVLQD